MMVKPHGKHGSSCLWSSSLRVNHIDGLFITQSKAFCDDRGAWHRVWDQDPLSENGVDTGVSQVSISSNINKGTLRGLHMLDIEAHETKTVHCFRGSVFDVVVDMRPASKTYLDYFAIVLGGQSNYRVSIPPGCAHGFQSLEDDTLLAYVMSTPYQPEMERGFHFKDPTFDIGWPLDLSQVSKKDDSWPLLGNQN